MSVHPDPLAPAPDARDKRWIVLGIVGLAVLIFGLHGQALRAGLFMDDWAHFRQLRAADWSLRGLTDACRLELVGGVVDIWWLPQVTLRFFRPVSFGLMKTVYTLSDWSPVAIHAASLMWHLAACTLLMFLLRRLGTPQWLAWATAALFAVHPGHIATVQWVACQSELIVTTLLLGATLCWGRFRGWPGFATATDAGPRPAWGWAVAAAVLFTLALGCRENAVMFPFVMAVMEPIVGRRGRGRALIMYGVFGVLLVGYLALRGYYLQGVALPPRPYVMPPSDPDFLHFIFDKACYYLISEFLLIPCVPIGGVPYFREHPVLFYGLTAVAAALLAFAALRLSRRGSGKLAAAWLLFFIAPVLPAFSSPHHLYLPGVGWAIAVMLILRAIAFPERTQISERRRAARLVLGKFTAVLLIALLGVMTFYFGLAIDTAQQVEDALTQELANAPSGLHDGDTIYIANFPLISHYAEWIVEEKTGLKDLRVVPLMWASRLLGPATPTERKWVDPQTLDVRIAEDRYFAGTLGLLASGATGGPIPDVVDRTAELGLKIEVLERDAVGIKALRFHFARPLTDPDVHLFWGSRLRYAYEVEPDETDMRE